MWAEKNYQEMFCGLTTSNWFSFEIFHSYIDCRYCIVLVEWFMIQLPCSGETKLRRNNNAKTDGEFENVYNMFLSKWWTKIIVLLRVRYSFYCRNIVSCQYYIHHKLTHLSKSRDHARRTLNISSLKWVFLSLNAEKLINNATDFSKQFLSFAMQSSKRTRLRWK